MEENVTIRREDFGRLEDMLGGNDPLLRPAPPDRKGHRILRVVMREPLVKHERLGSREAGDELARVVLRPGVEMSELLFALGCGLAGEVEMP